MVARVSREDGVPPLFGRQEFVAEADRLLEEASHGHGGGLLLRGAGGEGKSILLRAIVRRSRSRGFRVLNGRALPEELPPPFTLIRDLVRSNSGGLPPPSDAEEGAESLPIFLAPFAATGDRARPSGPSGGPTVDADELEGLLTPVASVSPEGHVAGREALLARLSEYFLDLARRQPLVLAIDDLHLADDSSLDFLTRLAGELPRAPAALVATVAEGAEVPDRTREAITGLDRIPGVRAKTLRPLSPAEVEQFVQWILGGRTPERADMMRWHAQTEGNPLLVEQLVRATTGFGAASTVGDDASRNATQIFLARIRTLGDAERRLLTHAAVLGKEFDFSKLAAVAGESEERVTESLDRLVQDGILRERGDEVYEFVTEAVRSTIYSELTETRRRLLHRRIGRALEARGGASDSELARQFYLGRDDAKAVEYNWRAAQSAARAYAFDTALSHLARALECERRHPNPDLRGQMRLLTEQGRLLEELGDLPRSMETLDEAVRLGRAHAGLELELGRALLGQAQVREDQNEYGPATTLANEALELFGTFGGPRDALAAHRILGIVSWRLGKLREAESHQRLALEIAEREGSPLEQGHALVDLGNTMVPLGSSRFHEAVEFYTRAAALFGTVEDHAAQARVMMDRAVLEYGAGHPDAAFTDLTAAIAAAERSRSPIFIGYCHLNLAEWEAERGRTVVAREALARAEEVLRPLGDRLGMQQSEMAAGMIAQSEGAFDEAEAHYQKSLATAREMMIPPEIAEMLFRLATLSQTRGDPETARERLGVAFQAGLREHRPDLAARADALLAPAAGPPDLQS
jgi:tetratricopeptide (TPR) repeat protein